MATLVNLEELIELIDKSPAVLWVGNGGVKERLLEAYGNDETE